MNFIYINNKVLAIALLNLNLNDTISLWRPLKVANVGRNLSSTSSILAIYFITNYYISFIQIYFTVFLVTYVFLYIAVQGLGLGLRVKKRSPNTMYDNHCFNLH